MNVRWSGRGLLLVLLSLAAPCQLPGDCGEDTPGIRLNQLGFYTAGAKHAIYPAQSTAPLDWELVDGAGRRRVSGRTRVFGDDPVSGEHVHRLDFSDFQEEGQGFTIRSGCAVSHPFAVSARPLERLKFDALAYFYHNRSGVPIEELYSGGSALARPAGHSHDVATCRTGIDPHGNDWPGCDYSLDLTGGWYDAGDHGKYVVNGGISVWTLMNLYERQQQLGKAPAFADGAASMPEAGNGVNDLLDEARFEMEFLLRMQAPAGAVARVPVNVKRNRTGIVFTPIDASGMAHHKVADENWTRLPTPPQMDRERRVLYPVSTAATLNLAATAAQCARIWRAMDPAFAKRCLDAAVNAYAAAQRNSEVYFIADFSGSGLYGDSGLSDEFFWAAAELFITTGDTKYGQALRASPWFSAALESEPAWPRVAPLGQISLASLPSTLEPAEVQALRRTIVSAADRFAAERDRSGYYIPFATDQYHWGSNSNLLNRAIVLALAGDFTAEPGYRNAVIDVMDYLLGRNPLDQSYVSGYGARPMKTPHHRYWAPSFDTGMPSPPPGALSGGPNSTNPADEVAKTLIGHCAPQTCWRDDVRAYSMNEVAINWNAPLVWVSAYLDEPMMDRSEP
jgi:endoglucanase